MAEHAQRKIICCIPAYNEERTIAKVVVGARKFADVVIVCDDGSSDTTGEIAKSLGAIVIRHETNRGKGEALRSLMAEARRYAPAAVVTVDADGQHDPSEIPRLVRPVLEGRGDVVIGTRPMQPGAMPRGRIVGNVVLDRMTSAKAGETLHDTQSGFRAYSLHAIEELKFEGRGMVVESQTLIDAVKLGLRIEEAPVSVTYEGIAPKRSPLMHFSQIVDYVLTRTVVDSPLLYLGVPGFLVTLGGLVAGGFVLESFGRTREVAMGTALITVILLVVGTVIMATSLILKFLKVQVSR